MTIEQAETIYNGIRKMNPLLDEAISVLSPVTQKPKIDVLDKIRAEIEQEYLAEGHLSDYWDAIDKCLQIVDKYMAESEVKK